MKRIPAFMMLVWACGMVAPLLRADFQAGAAVVDVTPVELPVLVNGGMFTRSATAVKTKVHARALVLSDGRISTALVVVDSCMLPRPLLDEAKALAEHRTGIPADRILISATHTHSAPSAMGCLGTDADPRYIPFLRQKLVEAIAAAQARLVPAQVGFASADAGEFTAVRRWIRRPDRRAKDPFGNPTVRATMHAGRNWDDAIGEAGPEDPELSLISLQTREGRPLAVLANFSMHYFSDQPLSADYFGLFAEGLKAQLAPDAPADAAPFVGIMSHGCSGDIWRRDYTKPPGERGEDQAIEAFAQALTAIAVDACRTINHRSDVDLAMAETRLHLDYRVPDVQLLEWAARIVAGMGDRPPATTQEVYAREQLILAERKSTTIVVQALRIGGIGIATTPTETYAITGLKIKAASPLEHTLVIELANGGDGYIPPPEQHLLGGYNTWPARSAGLEVTAEPKITEAAIRMLEIVAGKDRRAYTSVDGNAARVLMRAKPAGYWRLDEFFGPRAIDATGADRDGIYEPGVVFYLEGPRSSDFAGDSVNRAAHFAGGRLLVRPGGLGDNYSISLWIWNGMPVDGREVTGWFFSRGRDHGLGARSDHLGLGGSSGHTGRLIYAHGDAGGIAAAGRTEISRWSWHRVVFVRSGDTVRVYLDDDPAPEIETRAPAGLPADMDQIFLGGRSDNQSNWEGRLDEAAVFNRSLSAAEVRALGVP